MNRILKKTILYSIFINNNNSSITPTGNSKTTHYYITAIMQNFDKSLNTNVFNLIKYFEVKNSDNTIYIKENHSKYFEKTRN